MKKYRYIFLIVGIFVIGFLFGFYLIKDQEFAGFTSNTVNILGSQTSYEEIDDGYIGAATASSTAQAIDGLDSGRFWLAFRADNTSTGTIVIKPELSNDNTYWYEANITATSTNIVATSTKLSAPYVERIPLTANGSNTEATTTFEFPYYIMKGAKWLKVSARFEDADGDDWENGKIWLQFTGIDIR